MLAEFQKQLSQRLEEIKSQGLYKTERIVIPVREMVRLSMCVGCRADVLEIALRNRRLVFRKGARVATSRRCFARAQAERANRGTEKKEKAPVTQSRWLLTVIHNPVQGVFSHQYLARVPQDCVVINFVHPPLLWLS